jgi:hypothetical protein
MKKTRGRDEDCIDIFSVQSLRDIRDRHSRRCPFGSLLCPRKVSVDHYRNLGSLDSVRETLDMVGAY